MAVVKKIPESENGPAVKCIAAGGEEYIISQCLAPRRFTLWKHETGGYEKLKTSDTPIELYEAIEWDDPAKKKPAKKAK